MWFNIADLSDHCSVISLQTQEAGLCYWPSFTGMEHCPLHTRAVHMATCLEVERKVAGEIMRLYKMDLDFWDCFAIFQGQRIHMKHQQLFT